MIETLEIFDSTVLNGDSTSFSSAVDLSHFKVGSKLSFDMVLSGDGTVSGNYFVCDAESGTYFSPDSSGAVIFSGHASGTGRKIYDVDETFLSEFLKIQLINTSGDSTRTATVTGKLKIIS